MITGIPACFARKHRDDALFGDRLDDDEIELAGDAVIGLAGLQRRVQSGGLDSYLHAMRLGAFAEGFLGRRDIGMCGEGFE
jgi:hypothetical protein